MTQKGSNWDLLQVSKLLVKRPSKGFFFFSIYCPGSSFNVLKMTKFLKIEKCGGNLEKFKFKSKTSFAFVFQNISTFLTKSFKNNLGPNHFNAGIYLIWLVEKKVLWLEAAYSNVQAQNVFERSGTGYFNLEISINGFFATHKQCLLNFAFLLCFSAVFTLLF